MSKLPVETQFSSINDIIVKDFNYDGNLDVLVVVICSFLKLKPLEMILELGFCFWVMEKIISNQ